MNSRALGDFRMPILDVPFLSLLQVFVVKPVWLWYVGGWFEHWSKFAAIFPEKVMTMSSDPKPWSFSCLGCFLGMKCCPVMWGLWQTMIRIPTNQPVQWNVTRLMDHCLVDVSENPGWSTSRPDQVGQRALRGAPDRLGPVARKHQGVVYSSAALWEHLGSMWIFHHG